MSWVETQFPLSYRQAAKFTQIAKTLGSKVALKATLDGWGVNDLLELASAPDDFIDQALAGDVPLTKEEIKQAKQKAKLAEEARIRAEADAVNVGITLLIFWQLLC